MAADQSTTPPPDAGGPMLTRRRLLKTGAGAAAGGAVLGGAEVGPLDLDPVSPTGEADALLGPLVFAGGIMAGGWALDEIGILGSDDPPEGVSSDTLKTQIYQAAVKRKSVNQSTFVDNQNIVQYIPEAAFSEAKLAALDAIKSGATKDEAIQRGKQAANAHFTTVEKNLLKSWNESVREWRSFVDALKKADSTSLNAVISYDILDYDASAVSGFNGMQSIRTQSSTVSLSDGSDFDLLKVGFVYGISYDSGGSTTETLDWTPINTYTSDSKYVSEYSLRLDSEPYLSHVQWNDVWSSIQSTRQDVVDNVNLWVDNTYEGIQTGELSPDEYLSATDLANSIGQDSDRAQAIGNLVALNIPGDYDREATVRLSDGTTMKGYLATTDATNVSSLSAGTNIDPDATDDQGNDLYETWYMAFRPSTYIEPIEYYDSEYGIQGGEVRFTQDPTINQDGLPIEGKVEYVVETAAGESASIPVSEITEETDDDGNTYWAADLSGQLTELITEINRIRRVYAGDNPDTYQTMILDQPFEIVEIEGGESVEIQQNREPQSDDNYIKPEEWEQMSDQQQEIIDRIEELEEAAGGGFDLNIPGLPSIPTLPGMGIVGSAVVVGVGFLGLSALSS